MRSMTLEQQCCSLDLAKRLKELGVKQESLCSWKPDRQQLPTMTEAAKMSTRWMLFSSPPSEQDFSAFTSAELLNELPPNITVEKTTCVEDERRYVSLSFDRSNSPGDDGWELDRFYAATPADALAKMLVHLLESNLLPASHRG